MHHRKREKSGIPVGRLAAIIVTVALCSMPERGRAMSLGGWYLYLLVGAGETYDDNITMTSDHSSKDGSTTVTGGLQLKRETERTTFSLVGHFTQQYFNNLVSYNNNGQDATLDLRSDLSRYDRVTLTNDYRRSVDIRSLEYELGRPEGRFYYNLNNFGFTYQRDFGKDFTGTAKLANEYYKPERADLNATDMTLSGVRLDHALTSAHSLILVNDYYYRCFYLGETAREAKERGVFTTGESAMGSDFQLGYRYTITSQLFVEGLAGVNAVYSYNCTWYVAPALTLLVSNEIDRVSVINLTVKKLYFLDIYRLDINDRISISANFRREVLERWWFVFSAFQGWLKYLHDDERSTFLGITAAVSYDILSQVHASLKYTYHNRQSSESSLNEYDRNYGSFELSAEF